MTRITIDILRKCNLGCEFCYQNTAGTLSQKDIARIVEENPQYKTVELGGGEPFLHKDIISIIEDLRGKGKMVHITTNATTIPAGFLDLEDSMRKGIEMQVSLHAANPQLYKTITGKDLFNTVIANAQKISEKYFTHISSTIYQRNFNDVSNIVELAASLGMPIRINLAFPVGKGKNVKLLNSDQIDALRGYLLCQHFQSETPVNSPLVHTNNCSALQKHYCIAKQGNCPVECRTKAYIAPNGEKHDCEFLRGN